MVPRLWSLYILCSGLLLSGAATAQSNRDPHQAFDAALTSGHYEDADRQLLRIPDGPRRRLREARLALVHGRYAAVIRIAQRLVATHPLRARTLIGEARLAQGDWDGAQEALAMAAQDPGGHRARVFLGRLLVDRGQLKAAAPHLAALIADYNTDVIDGDSAPDLAYVAMAARALHSYHDANEAFAMSARVNPRRTETQLEWAELFLEKGDRAQAIESLAVALKYNPNHPKALTLRARLAAMSGLDFESAEGFLTRALGVNPHLADAHVVRAAMALRNMDIAGADRHLDAALQENPRHLWALSVRVAARFLADDPAGQAAAEAAVFAISPRYARMYSIVARYAEWEHRYDDLVAIAQRALGVDPEDPAAHAILALNLLRTGRENEGRAALTEAWNRDRFNARVFNLLNLFEESIDPHYERWQDAPFHIRTHRDERPTLEPYVGPLLHEAYGSMVDRYGFEPAGPLSIELFSKAEHFAIRTTGLPNIGVQGVCFGKLIAALSPAAGSFNWGQILWHELSHVFHLQLSKNHVPRWFTEGLAEYETVRARKAWQREEDHGLWLALQRGQLPKLSELNAAFTHADSPDALMTAYYVSYLAVAHLIERTGFDRVTPALRAWGEGKRTPQVLSEVFGLSLDAADAGFSRFLKARLAAYDRDFYVDLAAYDNLEERSRAARSAQAAEARAERLGALAIAHVARKEVQPAVAAAERALAIAPAEPQALFALGLARLAEGKLSDAHAALLAIVDGGRDGYDLRLILSRAARDLGRPQEALAHALAAADRDPNREEAWRQVLELSSPADRSHAERALRSLVRIDQHGRIPHMALLVILARKHAWREVRDLGRATIYVHPASAELHRLLGEAHAHLGEPKQAIAMYDQALVLRHRRPGIVQIARAKGFVALGQTRNAHRALDEALRADPDLAPRVREARRALGKPPPRRRP